MVTTTEEIIYDRGRPIKTAGIRIDEKRLIVHGRFLTVAQLRDEWFDDVGDPEQIIKHLSASRPVPDLFTFWQRLPDTVPLFSYHQETEALSALPLKNFEHWWKGQINSDTRMKAKRAEKRGVEVRVVTLDDAFVRGVMGIYNETPVRRGKPFWHYGKDFETVKEELSRDPARSKFIGAYSEGTLVGFVKLVYAEGRFANAALFLSKLEMRKKYVNNAMLAKSVELCCEDGLPFFAYTKWRRQGQEEFLVRNAFEKTLVPRYWIPLTTKGAIAIKLGLHRDIRTHIPDRLMDALLDFRKAFYSKRYKNDGGDSD